MNIGIIGSGNIGSALAQHLKSIGHQVMIANSRGPESLQDLAVQTGAIPVTVEEAIIGNDLVIIAIPEKAIPNLPKTMLAASKAIIVDAGNYYPSRDGKNTGIEGGLTDSKWVEHEIGHSVIKAFNNIVSQSLVSRAVPAGSPNRIALSVAGDDDKNKQVVMGIIEQIGFDAIDGGPISESWRQQPGEPAYCQDLQKEALQTALEKADFSKRVENLSKADEQARPYF